VNVVTGYGDEAGEPLVSHRQTQRDRFHRQCRHWKSAFARLAAERVKKVNLELGGNDPFIICDDVDIEVAVRGAVWAAFLNMGQVCTSGERFYVFDSVADEFIERFVDFLRFVGDWAIRWGLTSIFGPMISAAQRERVERKLDQVRELGATVLCGGKRPPDLHRGYYFEPTVCHEC